MPIAIKKSLHGIIFIGIIVFAIWMSVIAKKSDLVKEIVIQYSYPGIFFASIVSGFNILAPIPIIAFFPLFLVSGLNPLVTILLIIVGVTIADMFAYYIGRVGKRFVSYDVQKSANRFNKFLENYHKISLVLLFLFAAFAPFPNEILVIPMAFIGYRLSSLFIAVFFGNAIFNILAMFGIISLVQYI